jgi:copper(I)-binding protein
MSLKSTLLGAAMALTALPALAGDMQIMIKDPYARSGAKSGAAFFMIMNHGNEDDRLIAARSEAAPRVELHTHIEDANGVMKMREIEGGIEIPAGEMHALKRGGDHVMFMGLEAPFEQGAEVTVTLTFEKAGDVEVAIPVDNDRKDAHGGHGDHSHSN